MKKQLFKFDEITLEELGGGLSRKMLAHDDNLMVVYVNFTKNAIGSEHQHVHEQVTYCVSGKFSYNLEGEEFILTAGDSVYVKSNQLHGLKCLEEGTLLDIFSPARKDFLE